MKKIEVIQEKTVKSKSKKKPNKKEKAKLLPALGAPRNNVPVSAFQSADLLIQKFIESGVEVDKLEKLLKIKGDFEDKENKKIFQQKFAQMQSELPIIKKTKEVKNNAGTLMYSYAPLEQIVKQVGPTLKNHGFSFRWSEGLTEKDGFKRIYCTIMASGHEQKSFIDIPIMQATKTTNSAQQSGSSTSYGKRYSFCGALGIMIDDDDDDGRGAGQQGAAKAQAEPSEAKPDTLKIKLKEAIVSVTQKYKMLTKNTRPNEALQQWISQVQTHSLNEVLGMSQKLDQLIKKYGGTK